MRTRASIVLILAFRALVCCSGCSSSLATDPSAYIKPTVAVMKFENRAQFPMRWNLGGGMRDILVDRLVAAGRYHVIERPELDSIIRELKIQNSGMTRKHARAEVGRIKNVQYLIKATITDFGHVSTNSGFMSAKPMKMWGASHKAVMGMTLYVVDVESGEIITSESIEESVRASDLSVKARYRDVSLGGSVFYRTPLGRATARVIDKAVGRVTRSIAARPWQPRIALIQAGGMVVINGGRNRRVQSGVSYEVYKLGSPIVDPDTGDVIGHQPGQAIGRIQVCEVRPECSVANILAGSGQNFQIGQRCRLVAIQQQ